MVANFEMLYILSNFFNNSGKISTGILYGAKLKTAGVKVWDKCFPGQIHCLIGAGPADTTIKEFEALVKAAMAETVAK